MTIKSRFIHYAAFAALAAALAGCSSTPKLSAPPANANSGQQQAQPAGQTGGVNGNNLSGPAASVGRVVYFDFDSFAIKPEFQGLIAEHARYLQSHAASHVTLEGNTDERGSREYNLALGQRRAEAVQRVLVLGGASSGQIESVSFGAEKPADPGHNEAAYAKNRRVDFRYR
ncbi:MAG: peptidoglycan-associated lipoprotein Pal [Burkholderiaceae bacterium]|nr:peptidoglycan-associated lipoprotein Pal [Burkholderiaceae bacterium]